MLKSDGNECARNALGARGDAPEQAPLVWPPPAHQTGAFSCPLSTHSGHYANDSQRPNVDMSPAMDSVSPIVKRCYRGKFNEIVGAD